ncbi:Map microtubule affinity-regulating kinase [Chytriomyces hyalinus]|nr:Map microtubule affinity-regulating kinase [Chytriomyces hyalinus]
MSQRGNPPCIDVLSASAAYHTSCNDARAEALASPITREVYDRALNSRYNQPLCNVLPKFNTNKKDSEGESPVEAIANDKPAQEMLHLLLSQLSPQKESDNPDAKVRLRSKRNRQSSFKEEKKMSGIELVDVASAFVAPTQLCGTLTCEPDDMDTPLPTEGESTSDAFQSSAGKPSRNSIRQDSLKVEPQERPANLKEEGVLGDYLFQRIIGEGCFSKVKMAIHFPTGQKVAIKCMDKKAMSEEVGTAERTLREILVLSHVYHPNITRLLEVVDTADFIYLILEYEEGGELFDYIISRKVVPEDDARKLFGQLLGAIQYCHSNGIVHRDLKPENILLDRNGNMKLIDFGFSNVIREGHQMNTFCGSPSYAAPEMLSRKDYDGQGVDIWALGVVLFVMICGYHPFDNQNVRKMYTSIVTAKYVFPETHLLSDDAKSIISAIFKTKPSERATLHQLRNHPWTTSNGLLPLVEFHTLVADEPPPSRGDPCHLTDAALVKEIQRMGFSDEEIEWAKVTGDPGPVMAAYHLLRAEKRRLNALSKTISEQKRPHDIITDFSVKSPAQADTIPRTPITQELSAFEVVSPSKKSPFKTVVTNEGGPGYIASPSHDLTFVDAALQSPVSATSPSKRVSTGNPNSLLNKIRGAHADSPKKPTLELLNNAQPSSTCVRTDLSRMGLADAQHVLESRLTAVGIEWTNHAGPSPSQDSSALYYDCAWSHPTSLQEAATTPEQAMDNIMEGMLYEQSDLHFTLKLDASPPAVSLVKSEDSSRKNSFFIAQLLLSLQRYP